MGSCCSSTRTVGAEDRSVPQPAAPAPPRTTDYHEEHRCHHRAPFFTLDEDTQQPLPAVAAESRSPTSPPLAPPCGPSGASPDQETVVSSKTGDGTGDVRTTRSSPIADHLDCIVFVAAVADSPPKEKSGGGNENVSHPHLQLRGPRRAEDQLPVVTLVEITNSNPLNGESTNQSLNEGNNAEFSETRETRVDVSIAVTAVNELAPRVVSGEESFSTSPGALLVADSGSATGGSKSTDPSLVPTTFSSWSSADLAAAADVPPLTPHGAPLFTSHVSHSESSS